MEGCLACKHLSEGVVEEDAIPARCMMCYRGKPDLFEPLEVTVSITLGGGIRVPDLKHSYMTKGGGVK